MSAECMKVKMDYVDSPAFESLVPPYSHSALHYLLAWLRPRISSNHKAAPVQGLYVEHVSRDGTLRKPNAPTTPGDRVEA